MHGAKNTSKIINNLLLELLTAGIVISSLVAPGLGQILDLPPFKPKKNRAKQQKEIISYMKRQKLISIDKQSVNKYRIGLTKKGTERAKKFQVHSIAIQKPKKWDSRWRIIIFDIPETHKVGRNALTLKLKQLNFYNLQKSVWIYPYPCEEEIATISKYYGISEYVSFMEAASLSQQVEVSSHFGLPH